MITMTALISFYCSMYADTKLCSHEITTCVEYTTSQRIISSRIITSEDRLVHAFYMCTKDGYQR